MKCTRIRSCSSLFVKSPEVGEITMTSSPRFLSASKIIRQITWPPAISPPTITCATFTVLFRSPLLELNTHLKYTKHRGNRYPKSQCHQVRVRQKAWYRSRCLKLFQTLRGKFCA